MPYLVRRAVYESDDRNGMVLFCRHRPAVDVLLVVAVMAILLAVGGVAEFLLPGPRGGGLVFAGIAFGAVVVGTVLMRRGMPVTDVVGPETPEGRRWALMGLAQRPGTRYSALLLARRLLRGLERVTSWWPRRRTTAWPTRMNDSASPGRGSGGCTASSGEPCGWSSTPSTGTRR